MKKIRILLIIVGVIAFFACEKEGDLSTVELESSVVLNNIEPTDYENVLADSIADSIFTTFSWVPPTFNLAVTPNYDFEVDIAGNNFEDAVVFLKTGDTTQASVTVFTFNKYLTSNLGIAPDVEATVEVRLAAVLGEGINAYKNYSDPVTVTVKTYEPPFAPEKLYIHGKDSILGYILPVGGDEEGLYEGYVYVWQGGDEIQFGTQSGDILLGSLNSTEPDNDVDLDGTLEKNAPAFPVDSGYYQVTVNTYENSFDLYETHWGIIGSAVPPYDWSEDIDMTFDPATKLWTIIQEVEGAEFKFRPNDLWDPLNYGDDGANGIPDEYGANIAVSAGIRKFTLDLREYPYKYSVEDATK